MLIFGWTDSEMLIFSWTDSEMIIFDHFNRKIDIKISFLIILIKKIYIKSSF
jgi:hypothetical protein